MNIRNMLQHLIGGQEASFKVLALQLWFVLRNGIGLPLPHAWVTISGDDAMDLTLNTKGHRYFGVKFTRKQVENTRRWRDCSLLGPAFNTGLYADMDPELVKIVEAFAPVA